MKPLTVFLVLVALLGAAGAIGAADPPNQLLTEGGQLVTLGPGPSGATGKGDDPSSNSPEAGLVLEVRSASGEREVFEVPGSAQAPAQARGLVYQERHGLVYALWEKRVAEGVTRLYLSSHDGTAWRGSIDIAGDLGAILGSARLATSRTRTEEGGYRAVLHVTWKRATDGVALYSPLPLGAELPVSVTFDLDVFVRATSEPSEDHNGASTLNGPVLLRAASDAAYVHLALINAEQNRLVVLRVEPLPDEVLLLAEEARAQITLIGSHAPSREELASEVVSFVVEHARRFHPAMREFLAKTIERLVKDSEEAFDATGVKRLAEQVRAQITLIGSRFQAGGLEPKGEIWLLEPSGVLGKASLLVSVVSDWQLPPDIPQGPVLFLSSDGQRALFASVLEQGVLVLHGVDGEWSEVEKLGSADLEIDLDELLQARVEWASEIEQQNIPDR